MVYSSYSNSPPVIPSESRVQVADIFGIFALNYSGTRLAVYFIIARGNESRRREEELITVPTTTPTTTTLANGNPSEHQPQWQLKLQQRKSFKLSRRVGGLVVGGAVALVFEGTIRNSNGSGVGGWMVAASKCY